MEIEQTISSQVALIEEQRNTLRKKIQELEKMIENKNSEILQLKVNFKYEKFKNTVISQLLTTQTSIKIEDIFKEGKDEVNIYNFENGNIPVIVHDVLGESKQYNISAKKKTNPSGKNFRTVKNRINLIEEQPEKQEEKIKQVEKDIEKIAQKHFDFSEKEVNTNIETAFDEIVKHRVYKKSIEAIKNNRNKLLGKLGLLDYTNLIKQHVAKLGDIFSTVKKYDDKKISENIEQSLSSLDKRLIFYNQYFNSSLEVDDIERLKNAIEINMDYPKRFIPFSQRDLFQKFSDYSIAVFTIQDILQRILINPYGFPNIVYLNLNKSSPEDPYSFYTLEKIENGKRYWQMDCRIDSFSKALSQYLINYATKLFRKIYFDIFHDNLYRSDYREKATIANQDCEQLFCNIILISKAKKFAEILKKILVSNCTIQPSQMDKFNLIADDLLSKRHFLQEDNDENEVKNSIQGLFDNISEDDIASIMKDKEV